MAPSLRPRTRQTGRERRIAPTLVGAMATLVLAGCGATAQTQEAATTPTSGGTLRVAFDVDAGCVDGQQAGQNVALNVSRQTTDSLTYQDPETGELTPWLAESWESNDEATEFTFTLRDDVTFQDGSPFTSQSVANNFQAIVDLGAKSTLGGAYLSGLSSVETPDENTVTVRFEQPNAQFLQATSTMTLGYYSDATLAKTPEERCAGETVGTGPFAFEGYTPRQGVQLSRNDDYAWAPASAGRSGPAYLDGIDFSFVPEPAVRNGSLASGQIDVDTVVQPQDEELLEASDFTIVARANPGIVYNFILNESRPLFADERVRQAVSKSIDREQLAALLSRYQEPATSLLARSTPNYRDFSDLLAADPEGAAALLDEAGWTLNEETGIREKDGEPLSFSVLYWQAVPFLELVQQQLRENGIDLVLEQSTPAATQAAREAGTEDVEFMNLTRSDPDVLRTIYDANGGNRNNREPEAVDEALARSVQIKDPEERQVVVDEAVTGLVEDAHAVPLVELSGVMATAPRVRDFAYDASSRIQLYNTWLTDAGRGGEGS